LKISLYYIGYIYQSRTVRCQFCTQLNTAKQKIILPTWYNLSFSSPFLGQMLYTLQNDLYDCHLVCTCTMAYKQEAAKDILYTVTCSLERQGSP
jgi:hypothetical protein